MAVDDEPNSEPSAADVAQAARRLQILLDLIAFEAADLDSFLLDPTYAALLSPAERTLANALRALSESPVVATPDDDLPAGARMRQFLRDLGAPNLPPEED